MKAPRRSSLLLACAFVGLACGTQPSQPLQPYLQFSSDTLGLGRTSGQDSGTMSVELINTGGTTTAALAFAVAVSEGASSDFNIDWSACLPELAGGASCQISASVSTQTAGFEKAVLTATASNTRDHPSVQVTAEFGWMLQVSVYPGVDSQVTSTPGGLSCSTCGSSGDCDLICTGLFLDGTAISLDVAMTNGNSVQYESGSCASGSPGGTCNLVLTSDQSVFLETGPLVSISLTRDSTLDADTLGILRVTTPGSPGFHVSAPTQRAILS